MTPLANFAEALHLLLALTALWFLIFKLGHEYRLDALRDRLTPSEEYNNGQDTSMTNSREPIDKSITTDAPGQAGRTGSASKPNQLATQVLAISIPRNLSVDIAVKGDELKREDLAKIKSQFNRWIEGLEEAFEE